MIFIIQSRKEQEMKLRRTYNIIVNDIIIFTTSKMQEVITAFDEVRKSEPKAYIQTCYA